MAAMNPFEIFGLKPQFRIDKQKLDEKYFEIQKKVHPDRFASASDTETVSYTHLDVYKRQVLYRDASYPESR